MTPQPERVTIQDIANRANVSISTVSRVLSGNARVSEDKRQAVTRVVKELNYRPNIFARGLAGGLSMTVGVLTQNIGSPVYDAIMRGIITGLEGGDYFPIFADGQWRLGVEQAAIQTLLDRRVDGLIVVGGNLSVSTLQQVAAQAPLIVAAREIQELAGRCIHINNFQAAYEATRFLIEAGHREIAHIAGVVEHQDARRRYDGYCRALADAGLPVNSELIFEGNFRRQSGLLAVETLLTRGRTFSAIFAANDQMAFGARLALFRKGIRVPDDVSLVGFDDQSDSAYMTPPLTTVRQPAVEMGEAAAQALLHILRGEPYTAPVFQTRLVVRESVARMN